eukprot:m.227452 g.227452  ORF g.227452 m.227452 type:complete len:253 (-) comp17216_c0_seq1:94-852(-)
MGPLDPIALFREHPWLLTQCSYWLLLFIIPFAIASTIADQGLASRTGRYHWIYKPIRFRICQRFIGFVHAALLSYLCWADYFAEGCNFHLLDPNTPAVTQVLRLSLTYFIVDTSLDIVRGFEFLYLIHHLMLGSCFYFCLVHFPKGGGTGVMAMAIGEISNVVMVPWHAARFAEWKTEAALLSPIVTYSFTFCRCIIAPYFTFRFFFESLTYEHDIPWFFIYFYMSAFVVLLLGSWYWVYLLWRGFFKHNRS